MDDLERLLRGEQDGFRSAAPDPDSAVIAHVRGRARRRRAMRAVAASTVAIVAVGVVGVGVWGLAGTERADHLKPMESAPPSPTPAPVESPAPETSSSPTPTSTPEPEPTPEPEASPPEAPGLVGPPVDDSPDGIPDGSYPPLATDRGVLSSGDEGVTHYPAAHEIEDWVWDRTGPGWAVHVASVPDRVDDDFVLPPAVLYLVSPEGVHFDLGPLPQRTWSDARAVTWHEQTHTIRLAWFTPTGDAGGLYDMRTGMLDEIQMNVDGQPAFHYTFIAGNAQGDELWLASHYDGFKYYRWSASEGWHGSALVGEAPDATYLEVRPGFQTSAVSHDGDRLLLRPGTDELVSGSTLTMIEYRLGTNTVSEISFDLPEDIDDVSDFVQTEQGTLLGSSYVEASGASETLEFDLDSKQLINRSNRDYGFPKRPTYNIEYGKASSPIMGVSMCDC